MSLRRWMLGSLLVLAAAGLTVSSAQAADLVQTKAVPFATGQPIDLQMAVGELRVPRLLIAQDSQRMLDGVLPPHGGQSRFSWLRYGVYVENPGAARAKLSVQIRLLDKNGAVIDEFDFRGSVRRGRARNIDLRRLTLNYSIALIDRVEVTLALGR